MALALWRSNGGASHFACESASIHNCGPGQWPGGNSTVWVQSSGAVQATQIREIRFQGTKWCSHSDNHFETPNIYNIMRSNNHAFRESSGSYNSFNRFSRFPKMILYTIPLHRASKGYSLRSPSLLVKNTSRSVHLSQWHRVRFCWVFCIADNKFWT